MAVGTTQGAREGKETKLTDMKNDKAITTRENKRERDKQIVKD